MANENGWIRRCVGVGLTSFGGCALLYDAGLPGCLWRPWVWNSFPVGFLWEETGGHPHLRTGNGGNAMSGGMCGEDRSALAGYHRTDLRGPAVRSGTTGGIRALIRRPAGEMAVALRLGQFTSNTARQPQRIGAAGV